MKKSNSFWSGAIIFGVVLFSLASGIFLFAGDDISKTIGRILLGVTFLLAGTYFTWFHKSKPTLPWQITAMVTVVWFAVEFCLLEDKMWLTVDIVVFWALVFINIRREKGILPEHWDILLVEVFIYGAYIIRNIKYLEMAEQGWWSDKTFVLGVVSIPFIFPVVFWLLRKKGKKDSDYEGLGSQIFTAVLVSLFGAMGVWISLTALNYSLDRSEPVEYSVLIEDKEVYVAKRRRRTYTEYRFMLDIGGETVVFDVPLQEYDSYEIGDRFPINLYEGAFGEPFYISRNERN